MHISSPVLLQLFCRAWHCHLCRTASADPRHSDQKAKEQGNPDGESPLEPPQYGRMHLGDTRVHAPAVPLSFLRLVPYEFYVYVMLYALHVLVEEHSGTNVLKGENVIPG